MLQLVFVLASDHAKEFDPEAGDDDIKRVACECPVDDVVHVRVLCQRRQYYFLAFNTLKERVAQVGVALEDLHLDNPLV